MNRLGYVSGGYRAVWNRLEELIVTAGGEVRTGVGVRRIRSCSEGGLWIESGQREEHFDRVIVTTPVSILRNMIARELLTVAGDGEVEYLGVVCMVLVTRRPLVPYYVVNIADRRVPFTGVIGMSSVVSLQETSGRYLTYVPKYVMSDDPLLHRPDDEVRAMFSQGLKVMFPDLKPEDVESVHINRAARVQPLQVINYSRLVPAVSTQHDDFFVLNTSQFVNGTLNNNEVVKTVEEFTRKHGARFKRVPGQRDEAIVGAAAS